MIRQILEKTGQLDEKIAALKDISAGEARKLCTVRVDDAAVPEAEEEAERFSPETDRAEGTAGDKSYEGHLSDYKACEKEIRHLEKLKGDLLEQARNLTPAEKVYVARFARRPHVEDFIAGLFTDFFEQRGDHLYDEDASICGGIALFHGTPVTVVGHRKGRTVEENVACNFGMPCPEGYRKALRIMKEADKFRRPVITFIDTPGAYPGMEAEEHGQGEAIARNLAEMSAFTVPVITIVTGEGNSGGALALSVANRIYMLENSVYSILSPEGFASILWKDASRHEEACALMHMTAADLYEAGVCDGIIEEPLGGAQENPEEVYAAISTVLDKALKDYRGMTGTAIRAERNEKFRALGRVSA